VGTLLVEDRTKQGQIISRNHIMWGEMMDFAAMVNSQSE